MFKTNREEKLCQNLILIGLLILGICYADITQAGDFLLVFAGAGMQIPLDKIGKQFEEEYRVKVAYDYEGSGRLGNKILAGQRPDVFIPGGEKWAKLLREKGYVKAYWPIAYHIPVIITPPNNTKVKNLVDFMKKDVRLVLGDGKACAIGRIESCIFKKANLDETKMNVLAKGVTVKQLVYWIEGKNADASIVWRADAIQSGGKIRTVFIPKEINCIEIIPVCEINKALHPKMAKKYINYLFVKGKLIFKKMGFKVAE